jgi:hypothetical protein
VSVNVLSLLISLSLLSLPYGAHVWPMHLGGVMLLSVLALLVGVPCGIAGLFSSRRILAGLAIVLSVLPFPVAVVLWQVISTACGFESAH